MQIASTYLGGDAVKNAGQRRIDALQSFKRKCRTHKKMQASPVSIPLTRLIYTGLTVLLVVILLIFEGSFIGIDFLGAGTQFESHKLRIRNDTHFVRNNGTRKVGQFPRKGNPSIKEEVKLIDFTSEAKCDPNGYEIVNSPFGLIAEMPPEVEVVVTIDKPKFAEFVDNGGKINLIIANPTRRRMKTKENWFNMEYWIREDVWRDWGADNSVLVAETAPDADGVFTKKCFIPTCFSTKSIAPIWNLDLTWLHKGENWLTYNADGETFNQQPLLFRNYRASEVIVKKSSNFGGYLGFEHDGELTFKIGAATVKSIMVLENERIELSEGATVVLLVQNDFTMYGIVGRWPGEFYEEEFITEFAAASVEIKVVSEEDLTRNGQELAGASSKISIDNKNNWTCSYTSTSAKEWTIKCDK